MSLVSYISFINHKILAGKIELNLTEVDNTVVDTTLAHERTCLVCTEIISVMSYFPIEFAFFLGQAFCSHSTYVCQICSTTSQLECCGMSKMKKIQTLFLFNLISFCCGVQTHSRVA